MSIIRSSTQLLILLEPRISDDEGKCNGVRETRDADWITLWQRIWNQHEGQEWGTAYRGAKVHARGFVGDKIEKQRQRRDGDVLGIRIR